MNELMIKKPEEMSVEELGGEIRLLTRQMQGMILNFAIQVGYRLKLVQERVDHFPQWVEANTEFSKSAAYRYIKAYEEYGGQTGLFGVENAFPTLGKVSISNALRLLAVPEEEREEFAAEVDAENISTRELERAIAEKKAAEEAAKAAMAEKQRIAGDLETTRAERDRLNRENRELRNRPVEVAVEPESEESIAKRVEERTRELKESYEHNLAREVRAQGIERQQMQEAVEGWKIKLQTAEDNFTASEKLRSELADTCAGLRTEIEGLKRQIAASGTTELEDKLRTAEAELEKAKLRQAMAATNAYAQQGARLFGEAVESLKAIGDEETRKKVAGALRKMLESIMNEF